MFDPFEVETVVRTLTAGVAGAPHSRLSMFRPLRGLTDATYLKEMKADANRPKYVLLVNMALGSPESGAFFMVGPRRGPNFR